jgi:acetyltransferase-like isoleucine patch superfamily enzyme
MKKLFRVIISLLPWGVRRQILTRIYGFEIHPSASIGWAWVFPKKLRMGPGARIDHGTVVKGLEEVVLEENATIGRLNWITGEPMGSKSFSSNIHRKPKLILKRESAITNRHIIDCTDTVKIREYTTIAGFRSQILTHSIDLKKCSQECSPIEIGAYCFIGTAVTILGGSRLPDYSILGANSLLNQSLDEPYTLYAGVPAKPAKSLDRNLEYFHRKKGYVF